MQAVVVVVRTMQSQTMTRARWCEIAGKIRKKMQNEDEDEEADA